MTASLVMKAMGQVLNLGKLVSDNGGVYKTLKYKLEDIGKQLVKVDHGKVTNLFCGDKNRL